MRIKLCGLFREEDIIYANRAQPDYVGFVFAESRRKVLPGQAAIWRERLLPGIQVVGVFVNAPAEEIARCAGLCGLDAVQLHGGETEGELQNIRAITGKQIIRAVKVQNRSDVKAALDSSADYLLFDSGTGTGKTFDWRLLAGVDRPYFLAGGLDEDNLEEARELLHPYCVDLSSGAETGGVKDEGKMRRLTELAHRREQML